MVDDIPEKVDKDESTITAGGTRKKLIKHFSALSLVTTKLFSYLCRSMNEIASNSGELGEASAYSILEYTASDSKIYKTKY